MGCKKKLLEYFDNYMQKLSLKPLILVGLQRDSVEMKRARLGH